MGKKLYVSFVLDETGSMQGVKEQTISGFNEYVDTLKAEKNAKDIRFTLTKFNSEKVEIVNEAIKMSKVAHLNNETYRPAALTPLYDAIGRTIRSLEKKIEGKKMKALVVIQTDGFENHSKEFNQKGIFNLIEEKKKEGWTFAFLGADQDAWAAGQKMGIPKGSSLSYASASSREAFQEAAFSSSDYLRKQGRQTDEFFKPRREEREEK
jgi:hypothetical protein